ATMGQESEASQENALGIEIITRWQALDNLFFMLGYRGVETALSPWTYELHYSINATSQTGAGEVYQYVVPAENDVSQAIFAEYEWAIIPNTLTLLMGARVDDNNLREDETIFLPRLAVNWHIDNNWGTKYSYNTGYIRPGVGVGFLGQHQYNASIGKPIVGATESQEVSSHDLQLSFMSQKSVTNLNFYYNTIKKPFQIIYDDAAVINGEQVVVFYTNIEQTDTYGLELESKYIFDEVWDTYFSLSKVFSAKTKSMTGTSNGYSYDLNSTAFARGAFTPDGDMQGFPNFMLHAGVNFHMMDNLASNLHFRYWDEMEIRKPFSANGELLELDPQLFVDFNITYTEIAGSGVDLSFYVKNVLDNDDAGVYLFLWDNVWQAQGRRVGASFAYKF
ncbi:MAG: TonB-dependent receptor, partial [Sinobacterium sp.]|nr:TonB-dependent receptor [Sinobacterium sp.]